MRQIHQALRLLLLLPLNALQSILQLDIRNQNIAMDPQEACEEGLHGFEVTMRSKSGRETGEEG